MDMKDWLEGGYEPPPPDRVQVDPALKLTEREIAVLRISRATTAGEAVDLYEFHGIGKQVWAFAFAVCRLAGGVVENPGHCMGYFPQAAWALGLPAASKGGKPYIPSRPWVEWEAKWATEVAAMPEDWPLWGRWVREAEAREAAYKAAFAVAEKAVIAAEAAAAKAAEAAEAQEVAEREAKAEAKAAEASEAKAAEAKAAEAKATAATAAAAAAAATAAAVANGGFAGFVPVNQALEALKKAVKGFENLPEFSGKGFNKRLKAAKAIVTEAKAQALSAVALQRRHLERGAELGLIAPDQGQKALASLQKLALVVDSLWDEND